MTEYTTNAGKRLQDTNTHLEQRIAELEARIAELDKARRAAAHEPGCNYWKWDWRYSWHSSDCSCKRIAELEAEARKWREAWEDEISGGRQSRIAELEAALAAVYQTNIQNQGRIAELEAVEDEVTDLREKYLLAIDRVAELESEN